MISPNQIFTTRAPHIYICHASHILWKNLQAYNIEGTVQQEKEQKFQRASRALGFVLQLNEFHTIPSQTFTTYTSHNMFRNAAHFFLNKVVTT